MEHSREKGLVSLTASQTPTWLESVQLVTRGRWTGWAIFIHTEVQRHSSIKQKMRHEDGILQDQVIFKCWFMLGFLSRTPTALVLVSISPTPFRFHYCPDPNLSGASPFLGTFRKRQSTLKSLRNERNGNRQAWASVRFSCKHSNHKNLSLHWALMG